MAELSHCGDGRTLDSHWLLCSGVPSCAIAAEIELRHVFHQLTSHDDLAFDLLAGPEPIRPDHSELFACWLQRINGQVAIDGEMNEDGREVIDAPDRWLPFCPDLRRRIKKLVRILLAAKGSGTEMPDKLVLMPKRESLLNVLLTLKGVAADPCGPEPNQELLDQILRARKSLFLRAEDISNSDMDEFPYRARKRRARVCPSEASGGTEGEMLNQPKRRSQRTLDLLKIGDSHLPRIRIPVGSAFQADVPIWTGLPSQNLFSDKKIDTVDTRWLGSQIWPAEVCNVQKNKGNMGKGRLINRCYCTHPGSVECIQIHVKSARLQLKSSLGSVFTCWGFDEMGEDVSKSWTSEEQQNFDNIVRLNPLSQNKSFLEPATKFFTSKSKKDIVNYYYNVYVLRRMSCQTRASLETINSDDEDNDKVLDLGSYGRVLVPGVIYSSTSQSRNSETETMSQVRADEEDDEPLEDRRCQLKSRHNSSHFNRAGDEPLEGRRRHLKPLNLTCL